MQTWHEVRADGREPVRKKGELRPASIVVKVRQGRKACTFLTGYEPFGLQADELAEELRRVCASSTSGLCPLRCFCRAESDARTVSPVQGKPNSLEVMVQGKQIKAVTDMLIAHGVPKRWIESATEKKKK